MGLFKTYLQAVRASSTRLEQSGRDGYDAQFVLMERKGWSKTDWVLHMNLPIPAADLTQLEEDEEALLKAVPPQYLIGSAEFFGHRFKVSSDTLIPRPETEELVALVLKEGAENLPLNVVDIGTGTGAIAISLALARPQWKLWSVDISIGALTVAKENANALGAEVNFELGDTLLPFEEPRREKEDVEKFDIIVSNPPYISKDEWEVMDESVRKYEPETALFAEENGLAIYKKIAETAPKVLKKTGLLMVEIGYLQGTAVKEIFEQTFPTRTVEIIKDMSGLERMVYVHAESETN
ncbi:MAG: peptide chain release factor N(5)-glutamine methyltransferase [Lactobacillales bacterium]|jgi:release factor glutamine methyltransferase|nr:peptide chain release factor N(5)-glutamine methyltransferase [Lactobacillales bacterium]